MGLGSDADPATTAQRREAGNGRRRSRVAGFGDLHPWQLKVSGAGWPLGDRELQMRERRTGKEEGKEKGGERGPDRGGCRHRRGTRSGAPLPFQIEEAVARRWPRSDLDRALQEARARWWSSDLHLAATDGWVGGWIGAGDIRWLVEWI